MKDRFIENIILESMLTPDSDSDDKIKKIIKMTKNKDAPIIIINYIINWFSGRDMGGNISKDDFTMTFNCFDLLSKVYGKPKGDNFYRAVHLRITPDLNKKDLLGTHVISSGPTPLQSFSLTEDGALYFFNHFAKQQNGSANAQRDKTWVLIKVSSDNISPLISANTLNQFVSDAYAADIDKVFSYEDTKQIKKIATLYNELEMTKQNEIICEVKEKITADIIKIMVPASN